MKTRSLGGALVVSLLLAPASLRAQAPAAGELQVNTYTLGSQNYPSISSDPAGNYVVVWASPQDGSGLAIVGQRFDARGAAVGGEFQVNTYTTTAQNYPAVAHFPDGGFVVVWTGLLDGSSVGVGGQLFDAAGARVGGEFQVNSYTTQYQAAAQVSADAAGFVVAWQDYRPGGEGWNVAAQRFDRAGSRVGQELIVNTYTTDRQVSPAVASRPDGSFVVVWVSLLNVGETTNGIYAQRYDAGGSRLGGEFAVHVRTTDAQTWPAVATAPDGSFVVSWQTWEIEGAGAGYGVVARRFAADAQPLTAEIAVNTYTSGNQGQSTVRTDAQGDFVVTWRTPGTGDPSEVRARRFTASGAPRGDEFQVNTYTTGHQWTNSFGPSLGVDAGGNFVVSWRSFAQDGSDWGVFAQRFGGLRPAGLVVDPTSAAGSNGNRVLEPGEFAEVRPSWLNENGAAQAFGGSALSFTGPAGASYSITDGSASYGTVANGASSECSDCYGLAVSDPAPRPSLHWDATLLESIVPEAHGQRKSWRLHVGNSFSDVSISSPFYRFVETLLHRGVTGGCSATQYCPALATTREQMAVFVLSAKEQGGIRPPACATPMFTDVLADNPFCPFIEELARRGVVGGCGNNMYCPNDPVTREQMAVFVLRTLDPTLVPPACGTPVFADVPAESVFCRWIEELARRGVVSGCGGGNYCPSSPVTREQMGVFLGVTFGLTLYGS